MNEKYSKGNLFYFENFMKSLSTFWKKDFKAYPVSSVAGFFLLPKVKRFRLGTFLWIGHFSSSLMHLTQVPVRQAGQSKVSLLHRVQRFT